MTSVARPIAVLLVLGLIGSAWLASSVPAHGESPAREALQAAMARGRALWTQPWSEGSPTCVSCHNTPQNRMRAGRIKSYPKFDPGLLRIVTAQQKLNHMITTQARGAALPLGSDDLNALELYLGSLR